jgi:hypothetical protein
MDAGGRSECRWIPSGAWHKWGQNGVQTGQSLAGDEAQPTVD